MALIPTNETAARIMRMLNERDGDTGTGSGGTRGQARYVLVRCDSVTPVSTDPTHWGIQFWPATIIYAQSELLYPPNGTLAYASGVLGMPVLLTLIGDDVTVATPRAGGVYGGILTNYVDADASGSGSARVGGRPRVIGHDIPAGAVAPITSWKNPVRVATTAALPACTYSNGTSGVGATLTGNSNGALSAQNGVTLTVGQSVLVKTQATAANNGIYTLTQVGDGSHPFILTRRADADTAAEVQGAVVAVEEGTSDPDSVWKCTTNATIVVGTSSLPWVLIGPSILTSSQTIPGGSPYTITADNVEEDTGISITLPSAGQYLVNLGIEATMGFTGTPTPAAPEISGALYNGATFVSGSVWTAVCSPTPGIEVRGSANVSMLYTATGSTTLKVVAARYNYNSGSVTFTKSEIGKGSGHYINYVRLV